MSAPVEFLPREYQAQAMDFLSDHPRANLFADMGLGKTAIILAMINWLELDNVLIVAPKRVAFEVWPPERDKWIDFQDLPITALSGERVDKAHFLLATDRITTINYDELPWLFGELAGAWPFTTVICDESTRLKGFRLRKGSRRALALAQNAHAKVGRWWNLTGTPNANGLGDLWGPQWFVDGGKALGRTISDYWQRWFYREPNSKGHWTKLTPFAHSATEIMNRLKPTTLSIRAKDWFDVREPFEVKVWCHLPAPAKAQYLSMQRQFFAEIEAGIVTAANCAVKSGKLLQIASGAVYYAEEKWSDVHNEKLAALDSVVEEIAGANLMVVYQFVHERTRILERFPEAVDIRGAGAIEAWNRGEVRLLLAHPKSAGHGLNLQDGGHHICFFSPLWDLELYAQVLERLGPVRQLQAGYDRLVYVYHLLAHETIDPGVHARRLSKADEMETLMEYMK